MATTNTFTNANNSINLMKKIGGYSVSRKLGDIINMFIDLLCSNHPNEDRSETIETTTSVIPAFNKQEFTSRALFKMINAPFEKMVIREVSPEETVVFETTNIDLMFVALKYFNAYVEDTLHVGERFGFCWKNPADEKHYTVVLE